LRTRKRGERARYDNVCTPGRVSSILAEEKSLHQPTQSLFFIEVTRLYVEGHVEESATTGSFDEEILNIAVFGKQADLDPAPGQNIWISVLIINN
jgi:hypothetical protein